MKRPNIFSIKSFKKDVEHQFLIYKKSRISWFRFGCGPQAVICFHGYGENGTHFRFLEKLAGHLFSFYAIDLPFHGKTEWREELNFNQEDLRNIIIEITGPKERMMQQQKLILLGFSLGGRIALSLCQTIPEQTAKVVLLAPDGMKINFWYWLSTQTYPGKKIFYFTMQYPGWFFGLLRFFKQLGVVNNSIFRFVKYYIDNKTMRHELYNRWMSLRKLQPDPPGIKKQIQEHKILFRLVYGKHDRIIQATYGEKFRKGIEAYCRLTVIESGHQVLHEKHEQDIFNELTN